jgi:glutamate formiminotransferase
MFECVINVSEGRDLEILERLSVAAGPSLRDRHSDTFHNRSVFTLINAPADLLRGVRDLVNASFALVDLEGHEGVHPRLGVVDVVPFVALAPDTAASALRLRDLTAEWIATSHGVPVFLYGRVHDAERTLPYVRANAFKGLSPDFGPAHADAHRGAVVVGARGILVAWNIWLKGANLERARLLAQLIRRPGVRALGLQVGEDVQVSCNLVDLHLARPSQVYDQVADNLPPEARIDRAELVGLIPRSLLEVEARERWGQLGLSEEATIESRLALSELAST